MLVDILLNRRSQLRDAAEDPAANPLVRELTDKTLHQVEPRTTEMAEMGSNLGLIGIMRESGVLPGRSGSSSVESPNQRRDPMSLTSLDQEGRRIRGRLWWPPSESP